jgi:hypothetical protein
MLVETSLSVPACVMDFAKGIVPWPALSHAEGALRELFNGPRSTTGVAFRGGMCQRPAALLVTVVRSPLASDCAGAGAGGQAATSE